ncbi:DNA polymerase IV [candidate division WWE3 bacterium]|nr:DNA polymerase IV [candidate division WWE3 bacterium]
MFSISKPQSTHIETNQTLSTNQKTVPQPNTFKTNDKPSKTTRIIFHVDYDSFFASVEQQYHPELRGKPIGVTGSSLSRGVICAASREAKKLGVKTAMPVFKAKEICPQIITVKGDFSKYQYIHEKSIGIFQKYTDLIEPFSIDEAFLDMTSTITFFGTIEETIFKLKKDIFENFGSYITCSIGVGPNKLLAKLTSDINKPNGFYIITKDNFESVLLNSPLKDFCGIGKQIEKRLNKLGVTNVEQLRNASYTKLYDEFGNVESVFLKNLSFGVDSSPVLHVEHKELPKSIGHQHTLSKNTANPNILLNNLHRLSEMVGKRLRDHHMVGKTIGVYLRDSNFHGSFERKTINPATDSSRKIFEIVQNLFRKQNWKKETRLVGVTISNLTLKSLTPLPLFVEDQKEEKRDGIMDNINKKFGDFTLMPANTLNADQTKGKISSFLRH